LHLLHGTVANGGKSGEMKFLTPHPKQVTMRRGLRTSSFDTGIAVITLSSFIGITRLGGKPEGSLIPSLVTLPHPNLGSNRPSA
jgi:hypothetical protein